ncbi:MAG: hypothetical protein HKM95_11355 [Inquilinus sp.]|nr:hypothetical protein [Inquilinus sp.]
MANANYAAQRISAALLESGGDAGTAQRALAKQCATDQRLLRALVAPFLRGIIAHAVTRGERAAKVRPSATAMSGAALDTVVGHLGRAIGETELPRGMTALTEPASRPAASKRHQEAIRLLATAYRKPR